MGGTQFSPPLPTSHPLAQRCSHSEDLCFWNQLAFQILGHVTSLACLALLIVQENTPLVDLSRLSRQRQIRVLGVSLGCSARPPSQYEMYWVGMISSATQIFLKLLLRRPVLLKEIKLCFFQMRDSVGDICGPQFIMQYFYPVPVQLIKATAISQFNLYKYRMSFLFWQ